MPVIQIATVIAAPQERVFDLARSIELHQATTAKTGEHAVAGVTQGLIGLGQEVTWEARHFGVKQKLTVRITEFDRPRHFQDVMVSGAFKSMKHDHDLEMIEAGTLMKDRFEFASPFGFLGQMVDGLVLRRYLQRFLVERNDFLKKVAEAGDWKRFLVLD